MSRTAGEAQYASHDDQPDRHRAAPPARARRPRHLHRDARAPGAGAAAAPLGPAAVAELGVAAALRLGHGAVADLAREFLGVVRRLVTQRPRRTEVPPAAGVARG